MAASLLEHETVETEEVLAILGDKPWPPNRPPSKRRRSSRSRPPRRREPEPRPERPKRFPPTISPEPA